VKILTLPTPPNPSDARYVGSQHAFMQAQYQWAQQLVGLLLDHSRVNDAPCASPVLPTDTVATLIGALTQKGIVSPTVGRNST
jgi:hypothetical protein